MTQRRGRDRDAGRRRQHAPTRRAAPAGRRHGGPPGRSAPAPAARREPRRSRPTDTRAKRDLAPSRATRTTRRPPPPRRPGTQRTIKAPDPKQRARRTIRVRTARLTSRFSAGQPRKRLITTLVVMLMILSAVLVKVGALQTFEGDALRNAATQQWTRDRALRAQRGSIFDRNGEELALSVPASTIAVNPRQVEDPVGTAETFAAVLSLSDERRDELAALMAAQDRGFLYIDRQVDDSLAKQLGDLELAGVTIYREDRRTLPGGDTARSVIGRTDIDGVGTAGIEKQYDNVLAGKPGELTLEVAPGGRSIAGSEQIVEEPVPGNDIVLTLDRSVQYATEQALLKRVSELRARGGQVIVMGSKTGEVIAMASVRINEDGVYEITSGNYSAVDAYEPGSVGKVITIAGALNEGTVTAASTFVVPWQKVYTNNGDRLHDSHQHGTDPMSVEEILVQSSNIGTITVSETMGFERQYHYMRSFGLGERTALAFPDETAGILNPWQTWEGTEKYTVAYGQGVASSPIQLISAVNTIANDGVYIAPKLVKATVDASGEVREMPASATHEVVSPEVAVEMQRMMRQVVCRGTAKQARVEGLSIAGKTGTGFIAQPDGGYDLPDGTRAYYASFVGFLPAEDPQVTILVSIDQPPADSGDRFGGTAAAPVFRELAPTMIHELGIEPPPGSTGCDG